MTLDLWKLEFITHLTTLFSQIDKNQGYTSFQFGMKGSLTNSIILSFMLKSLNRIEYLDIKEKMVNTQTKTYGYDYLGDYFFSISYGKKQRLAIKPRQFWEQLDWKDSWNEINKVGLYLRSLYLDNNKDDTIYILNKIKNKFSTFNLQNYRLCSNTQILGILSHLLPFEFYCNYYLFDRNIKNLNWIFEQQNKDGHFYPVLGGGACPNLNAVNCLISFLYFDNQYKNLITDKLEPLLNSILNHNDNVLMSESLRGNPLTILELKDLKISDEIIFWVTNNGLNENGEIFNLHKPDTWSTWIWILMSIKIEALLTNKKINFLCEEHFTFGI